MQLRFAFAPVWLTLGLLWGVPALAVPINYGDFVGTSVAFLQVTEDSGTDPTPLLGAPSVAGNTLDFDPVGFNSSSTGNAADVTDSTLSFQIVSLGAGISSILFNEQGDLVLTGLTGDALASAFLNIFVEVLEIDGNPVLVNLGGFNLTLANAQLSVDGPGSQLWGGPAEIPVSALLGALGYEGAATRVRVILNNTLSTASLAGAAAFIAKKDLDLTVTLPEPGALALMGLGLLGLGWSGRPRRR